MDYTNVVKFSSRVSMKLEFLLLLHENKIKVVTTNMLSMVIVASVKEPVPFKFHVSNDDFTFQHLPIIGAIICLWLLYLSNFT